MINVLWFFEVLQVAVLQHLTIVSNELNRDVVRISGDKELVGKQLYALRRIVLHTVIADSPVHVYRCCQPGLRVTAD